MTYRVTQQDIDAGLRADREWCPVARAIRRRHQTKNVYVQYVFIHIGDKKHLTPERVQEWMAAFDKGIFVNPIRFEL